ncbi:MAG: DUF4197 domain-containing protein [Cytophagaceae bacterium]
MLRRLPLILMSALILFAAGCQDIMKDIKSGLTEEEIVAGLKKALEVGTDTSVKRLHAVNGFYQDQLLKILLPPEADVIFTQINKLPGAVKDTLQNQIEKVVQSMNRSAEDAAVKATPIFVKAITEITIEDGINILHGADTAATHYLKGKTFNPLRDAFKPDILNSLRKPLVFNQSAESLYGDLINGYNTAADAYNVLILFTGEPAIPKITNNSLSNHVTTKALTGLFHKVGDEERMIRKDPLHRVSEILKKVFGELDR